MEIGIRDVAFNACAICPYSAALFNLFIFGITEQLAVDHLPGLIGQDLDVAVQRRFLEAFFCDNNTAKPP